VTIEDAEYLRNLQTVAVKMAAFCARLSGVDDMPERVSQEGMKLCHEYKRVDTDHKLRNKYIGVLPQ
jgi:hypothetical protein